MSFKIMTPLTQLSWQLVVAVLWNRSGAFRVPQLTCIPLQRTLGILHNLLLSRKSWAEHVTNLHLLFFSVK